MRLRGWQDAYEFARARGDAPLDAERYATLLFPAAEVQGLVGVPYPDAVVEELHAGRDQPKPKEES